MEGVNGGGPVNSYEISTSLIYSYVPLTNISFECQCPRQNSHKTGEVRGEHFIGSATDLP